MDVWITSPAYSLASVSYTEGNCRSYVKQQSVGTPGPPHAVSSRAQAPYFLPFRVMFFDSVEFSLPRISALLESILVSSDMRPNICG